VFHCEGINRKAIISLLGAALLCYMLLSMLLKWSLLAVLLLAACALVRAADLAAFDTTTAVQPLAAYLANCNSARLMHLGAIQDTNFATIWFVISQLIL
jgi:hypothetical protein